MTHRSVGTVTSLIQHGCGGSVWESNLLGADSPSTYEERRGRNWKDLASPGTLNAASLPPRFFIPLFSSEEPFRRLDCWPPASHRAPLACRCSWSCEYPNDAEVLAALSSQPATSARASNTNAESCASPKHRLRHVFRREASDRVESSTAIVDVPSRKDSGTTNRSSPLLEPFRLCIQARGPPSLHARATSGLSLASSLHLRGRLRLPVECGLQGLSNQSRPTAAPRVRLP